MKISSRHQDLQKFAMETVKVPFGRPLCLFWIALPVGKQEATDHKTGSSTTFAFYSLLHLFPKRIMTKETSQEPRSIILTSRKISSSKNWHFSDVESDHKVVELRN
jgi:hypothetical protein